MNEKIIEALKWRYAVQVFDQSKKVSEEDLHTILDAGRLAPSSAGLEAWKFIVVENADIRAKLREAGFDQHKITEASHLIVVAYRTDAEENIARERVERTAKAQHQSVEELSGLKSMAEGSIASHQKSGDLEAWIKAQAYIPLGMMMETASLLAVDNAAMEGFTNSKVDQILGLSERNLKSAAMLALGYRGDDAASNRAKTRRDFDDAVEFIK